MFGKITIPDTNVKDFKFSTPTLTDPNAADATSIKPQSPIFTSRIRPKQA